MAHPFQFTHASSDSTDQLEFSGNINENSQFPDQDQLKMTSLKISLKEVLLINSLGIRAWTRWMNSLSAKVITLDHCTPSIVHQMNIISGFLPAKSVVNSFYVPFYCEACDTESIVLLEKNKDFFPKTTETNAKINLTSPLDCESCGGKKELDVLPDKYFAFLKR